MWQVGRGASWHVAVCTSCKIQKSGHGLKERHGRTCGRLGVAPAGTSQIPATLESGMM